MVWVWFGHQQFEYGGYFGLKHADQTYGSEYMMISNDNHTYISCSTDKSIYIRPSANSSSHETVFAHDNSTFKNKDNLPMRNFKCLGFKCHNLDIGRKQIVTPLNQELQPINISINLSNSS
mgnify:CR=1 FL=1